MKTRFHAISIMMMCALVLSLMPAAATASSVAAAQSCTDKAQFIADVTVPDGTRFDPGAAFTKVWQLRNVGTCTWTTSYSLVFDSGEKMGATTSSNFANNIAPGQIIDITTNMTAPGAAGHYIGYWKFKNASGALFGIGVNANKAWWVEINVIGSSTTNIVYDFGAKAGEATWSSGAGGLSFPGADGDAKGFAIKKDKPKFESGVEMAQAGLLFAPQNLTNGFIQGRYTAFKVENGDRFQTRVGCDFGATSCYVAYRLDFEVGNTIRTFWTFRERYEGLTYDANIDLSPLAGQEVKFILYISSYGSPVGDRALWGNPVIVRKGGAPPPTVTGTPPTSTPTRTPGPVTVTVPPSACDRAQFIADVTVPDGTTFAPGATFTKTWRLKNVGSCAWTTSYQLAFFSGEQMGAPAAAAFPKTVEVGQTVDISINMTAPSAAGSYRGNWMFKNASGALFGIGSQANKPWWVDIKVSGPTVTPGGPSKTPTPTATSGGPTVTPVPGSVLDFASAACSATWFSGAGQLPCPGAEGDARGFVLKLNSAKLETGATDPRPTILTFPQNVSSGYIQGYYPAFRVQAGDRFRATIGCEGGSTLCYVAFRLDYESSPGQVATFWGPFLERYEGQVFNVDVDLSPLAGKDVKFALSALAVGPAPGDRALWVGPHIYRPTGGGGALPDLAINSLSVSFPNPSCFNPGEALGMRVSVTNSGQAAVGNFVVQSGSAQQTVSGLAVGESKSVFFTSFANPATVTVDPGNTVAESNEQNNSRTENLPTPTPPLPCAGTPTFTSTPGSAPSPTFTATPDPLSGWNVFQNGKYKFGVKIPPNSTASMTDNSGRADFQFAPNTNLREKYLAVTITDGAAVCKYANGVATSSSTVTINGIQFLKEEGSEGAAGSFYDWLSFSTVKNNACINLAFVLRSVNPGNLPTPPPIFDKAAESVLFNQIINSFAFTP